MDIWLKHFAHFLAIIRPKSYNVITRIIISLGVLLVTESQLNVLQALTIALYEQFIGDSTVFRELLESNPTLWVGLFLIVIGLIYHYSMTVGQNLIAIRLAEIPKRPQLCLEVLNSDLEPYKDDSISLRGHIVDALKENEIPKYESSPITPYQSAMSNMMNSYRDIGRNRHFYKERNELLKIWGGSELLSLKISNNSPVLATGVRVEMKLPRLKGISADNTKDEYPELPSHEASDPFGSISSLIHPKISVPYDIKGNHSSSEYCFNWSVGIVQANTNRVSDTYIFLRSERSFEIELKIYCDQLENPIIQKYPVTRDGQPITLTCSQLQADENEFYELANKCIMNGYLGRVYERRLSEYVHKHEELIPK